MAEKQEISTDGGSAAPLCANDCGFFGSADKNNFCSRCYEAINASIEENATTIKPDSSSSYKTAVTEEQEEEAPDAILCAGGCGFFGSAKNNNLCSMCYVDSTVEAFDATPALLEKIKADLAATEEQPPPAAEETPAIEAAPAAKPKPNRCYTCRKKVGLLGFACRCGGTFCSLHRFADAHACDFDYKEMGREEIAKNNPLVMPSKIDKI